MDTPEHRRREAPRRSAHAGRTVYLTGSQATPVPEAAPVEAAPDAVEIEAATPGGEGDEESNQ